MQEVLIQSKSLAKSYDGSSLILEDLNLRIEQGSFSILMGRSGAGKSTLLNILAGLEKFQSGELLFGGKPMQGASEKDWALFRRTGIGIVFQDHNLIPYLSLMENCLLAGRLGNKKLDSVKIRARALFEELGIHHLADRLPSSVSGGERQRAAIARALINRPPILFADEPTGSLNEAAAKSVMEVFARLHKNGQSILLATHDLKAACYGTEVWFLRDGKTLSHWQADEADHSKKESRLYNWLQTQGW